MEQPGRILVIGCGSVSQCTLPLLLAEIDIPPSSVTVLDMVDNREKIAGALAAGVRYDNAQITPENLDAELSARLGPGDLCLDLAWNIDTCTIVDWCRAHGVRYVNTSTELWDPYEDAATTPPRDRTLYVRHMALRRMIARWGDNTGPSAVVEHGANPGLVSHFTKQALEEIATMALKEGRAGGATPAVEAALAELRYPDLAQRLGVKVIHISERDTQITDRPKEVNEF